MIRRVAMNAGSFVRIVCKVPLVVGHEMAESDHQSWRLEVLLTIAFDDPDRMRETLRLTGRREGDLRAVRSRRTLRSRVRRRLGARVIIGTLLLERFGRPGPMVRRRVRRGPVGVDAGRSGCDPPEETHEECADEDAADLTLRRAHEPPHLPSVVYRPAPNDRPFDASPVTVSEHGPEPPPPPNRVP